MSLFKRKVEPENLAAERSVLAEMVLNNIHDGVIITDRAGIVRIINPAATRMLNCGEINAATGLDYALVMRLESKEGGQLSEAQNSLMQAMKTGQVLVNFVGTLIAQKTEKKIPLSISVFPVEGVQGYRIITFRDITDELKEEGEQAEFISTASHEMRTPVASIEGYLSLALNPQTATIDERARGYLNAAHEASKHLGNLFRDLLDVTKFDDGRVKPNFVPVELVGAVKQIVDGHLQQIANKKLKYQFGSEASNLGGPRKMQQVVYGYVDMQFLREVLGNLIENAIKYTPAGGSIYVNVLGDGDRALINVTDTGMGISTDDLQHIFQKFYRADNSQTREVGGTGLGLYLVKQRVETMGGKVWAESGFGEGSTFYVSLPRITGEEYEKRLIDYQRQQAAVQAAQIAQLRPVTTAQVSGGIK